MLDGIDIELQDAVNLVLPDRTGARYRCLACHLSPARPSSRNSTMVCCRLTAALWPCARSSNAFALLDAVLATARMRPWRPASAPVVHYAPAENLEHVDVALIDAPSMKSIWCYLFLPRSSVEGASPASPAPGECFDSASSRSKSAKTSAMSVARLGSSAAGVCANRIRR
jgi:hypothetical protein